MLDITLQQTRVYQDAKAEGELVGEARMLLRMLARRLGDLPSSVSDRIQQLTVSQLEDLGEALFDFVSLADVESWLNQK